MNIQQAYSSLGLRSGATTPDLIRRAFRQKAHEVHPDKNPADMHAACEKFVEIKRAYDLLQDVGLCRRVDISRIKHLYRNGTRQHAVEVSEAEVDALYREKEWAILKYCAIHSADFEVQARAMEQLAAGGRFFDLLDVSRAIKRQGKEQTATILSIFEANIARILSRTDGSLQRGDLGKITQYILKATSRPGIAEMILNDSVRNNRSFDLSKIGDPQVARLAVETLVRNQRWVELLRQAKHLRAFGRDETWRALISLLEGQLEQLVETLPSDILCFIARNTQSRPIRSQILEALAQGGEHRAIRNIIEEIRRLSCLVAPQCSRAAA